MLTAISIVVFLIAALLIYAASRPSDFIIARSARIETRPDAIFPLIDDFRNWAVWSPYEKLDPAMERTYSGARSGPGAVYSWKSNGKAGVGRMEIVRSVPASLVSLKLDFEKPFKASNTAEFSLEPQGEATTVTWAMPGRHVFIGKLFGLFVNLDRLIGKDFEAGLANLGQAAEGRAPVI